MPRFDCFIDGDPVPWKAPTFNSKTKRAFSSAEMKAWKAEVGWKWKKRNGPYYEGDVKVTFGFYCRDESHGDLTNLIKCVEDALQGLAYENDRQVKRHGESFVEVDPMCGVMVTIEEAV